MAVNEIHVGDIGTTFRVTVVENDVVLDVSTSLTRTLYFKKPDETVVGQTAVFTTDGTNGQIEYVAVSGDLDQAGVWRLQALLTFAGGTRWSAEVGRFTVHDTIHGT